MQAIKNFAKMLPVLLALVMVGLQPARSTTTTYAYNDSHVSWLGQYQFGSGSGHSYAQPLANSPWGVATGFNGTQVGVQVDAATAGAFQYSIDGAAFQTSSIGTTGSFATYTIATGLTDTSHSIVIKYIGANVIYFAQDATFTITGSSPSLSVPANYGPIYAPGSNSTDQLNRIGISSFSNLEGLWTVASGGAYTPNFVNNTNPAGSGWSDCDVDVYATTPAIWIWCNCNGTRVDLIQDGVALTHIDLPSTGIGLAQIATGLDSTHQHEYQIVFASPTSNLGFIMTPGGTINTSTGPPVRPVWYFIGDSITANQVGTAGTPSSSGTSSNADSYFGWVSMLARANNVQIYNFGIGGTTVFNTAGQPGTSGTSLVTTYSGQARVSTFIGLSTPPSHIFVMYGVNDLMNVSGMSPAETVLQYQAGEYGLLSPLVSAYPNVPITVISVLRRSGYTDAQIEAWDVGATNAIAATGAHNITYLDATTWINVSTDTQDNLHPNSSGNRKIFLQVQAALTGGRGRSQGK